MQTRKGSWRRGWRCVISRDFSSGVRSGTRSVIAAYSVEGESERSEDGTDKPEEEVEKRQGDVCCPKQAERTHGTMA